MQSTFALTMAKFLKLRLGVSDDPTALQPSLSDCMEAVVQHAELVMTEVLRGLESAVLQNGPRRSTALQSPSIRTAVLTLLERLPEVNGQFRTELSREMYHSGGKDDNNGEVLRFEDLKLFEDADLDQSIEVARAQQEVSLAVDDVLPGLDSLISTLLGWRTIQPGLNPLRPEVFVRALQSCLALQVTDASVRESLITPAAGLLGIQLQKIYREIIDWLKSSGVEPAVPLGGKVNKGHAGTSVVSDTMAKTLLTLDKLRKLLSGDFDQQAPKRDFLHTVPASMVALQDLKQVDVLVKRLEQRAKQEPAPVAEPVAAPAQPLQSDEPPRMGHQLGAEVVRLMFDNLDHDARLLQPLKRQLRAMEPAVLRLAREDSRFFSDRTHSGRQLLDVIAQRSLAFPSESHEGWRRFMDSVDDAVHWLSGKVVDADVVGELIDHLQAEWDRQDKNVHARNAEAARALAHAEQRNLLAQKLAGDFEQVMEGLEIADFVRDFLRGSWSQVVADARLSSPDGSDDPFGYRALVDDLIWSVQKSTARRGRAKRLAQMIPGLLDKLRQGLERISYPPELSARIFDGLGALHYAALEDGKNARAQAAADAAEATPSQFSEGDLEGVDPWLAGHEAQESGYLGGDSVLPEDFAAVAPADEPAALGPTSEMRTGTWVELMFNGQWLRVQLTWASPHATLFMFTSPAGTAHSMSRRTLDRLRGQGLIRVVADRHVVDEALDEVAKAALRNSLSDKS
ncbi:MAG: DUF1631 family protein [Ramlibacter sp.]|nr:DUF1631 family protein [Ramlibacter sp.]